MGLMMTMSHGIGIFSDLGLAVKGAPMTSAVVASNTTNTKSILYGASAPNFSSGELIGYDPETKTQTYQVLPNGLTDSISMVTTSDGTIYGGAEFPARLWAYNPVSDTAIRYLGEVNPGSMEIWSMTVGADGKVYMGLEPDAVMSVYDPTFGTFSTIIPAFTSIIILKTT